MKFYGYKYRNYTIPVTDMERGPSRVSVPVSEGILMLTDYLGQTSVFDASEISFHAPSEHTIDGKQFDLEMHFTHRNENGEIGSIISFLFDQLEGADYQNQFLETLWADEEQLSVNLYKYFRNVDFTEYWNYEGSLTAPPCTEGVLWTVVKDIQPIDAEQLERFTSLWAGNSSWAKGNGNNRSVQSLNERTIAYKDAMSMMTSLLMTSVINYLLFF